MEWDGEAGDMLSAWLLDPKSDTALVEKWVVFWHDTVHEVRSVCYPVDASFFFPFLFDVMCADSLLANRCSDFSVCIVSSSTRKIGGRNSHVVNSTQMLSGSA